MADVSIVTTDGTGASRTGRAFRSLVFVTADVGYFFYVDASADLYYVKTTDGGASWGGSTLVRTGTVTGFDVWWDQWTPGDAGDLIHIWYMDAAAHDVLYRNLDTASSDTLGTEATVFGGTTGFSTGAITVSVSGAKMRGGNLLCCYTYATGISTSGTYRSTDGGASWGVRTNVMETGLDWAVVFPGNEADNQDAWILFADTSANQLTLKVHDDSADTNSESAALTAFAESTTDGPGQYGFSAAIRHSDGHLIVAYQTELDTATADFLVYDINGTGSITALTNITTNIDDNYYPSVFIDNETDDIYVAYVGKRDGSETLGTTAGVYYTKSTDGGSTWSAGDTAYSASVTDYRRTWAPPGGYRFAVAWRDVSSFECLTNYDNSLDLTPAAGGITGPLVGAGHLSGNGPLVGGRLVG